MEDFSQQPLKGRYPLNIELRPYLRDHFLEGKTIFPAVEIMITLARAVRERHRQADLQMIASAQFNKMLVLDPEAQIQETQIETVIDDQGVSAKLFTSVASKSGSMRRTLEHASLTFVRTAAWPAPSLAFRAAWKLERGCINVPAVSIYRDLVPFGLSYQNITGDLSVSEEGAIAEIYGGGNDADDTLLGSPFVFDAAMHAACVWGQRFCNMVAFPVGFDRRMIYTPTKKGASYTARITPVEVSREPLIFNAWIFDSDGAICEEISGLKMRDMTGGRMKPPEWIREGACKKLF